MLNKLLQTNLNHASRAHDLFLQTMAELDYAVAVIAEPYTIPIDHPHWTANATESVAITWRQTKNPKCTALDSGDYHVAIRWGRMIIIGVCISPNIIIAEYEETLHSLETCVLRYQALSTIICGDFNAKSRVWGATVEDGRGRLLVQWMVEIGMCCLNTGNESTCIRPQGESIVDVSFVNRAVSVRSWNVLQTVTESDHVHIGIHLGETAAQQRRRNGPTQQRWNIKKLDDDGFQAVLEVGHWAPGDRLEEPDLGRRAEKLQAIMIAACDSAIPRVAPRPRRAVPWWSDELASLRGHVSAARRVLKRARRRQNIDEEELQQRAEELRNARAELRKAIAKAKAESWQEFVLTLNEDPWGRSYLTVLNKLRRSPPPTEALEGAVREAVLGGLFPPSPVDDNVDDWEESSARSGVV